MAAVAPQYSAGAWFTTTTFAQKNPEAIRRFSSVIYETAKWANTHHTETVPILAKYSKLTPEAISGMIRVEFAEQLRPVEIQLLLDAGTKLGFLPRTVNAAELLPR